MTEAMAGEAKQDRIVITHQEDVMILRDGDVMIHLVVVRRLLVVVHRLLVQSKRKGKHDFF